MDNEQIKWLEEAAKRTNAEAEAKAIRQDAALKSMLGNNEYYTLVDYITLRSLKDMLEPMLDPDWDPHETPDNKAKDIAALFHVISMWTTSKDYYEYVSQLHENKGQNNG